MTTLLKNITNQIKENLENNGKRRFHVEVYNKTCLVWVSNGKATLCWKPLTSLLGARTIKSLSKASQQLQEITFQHNALNSSVLV